MAKRETAMDFLGDLSDETPRQYLAVSSITPDPDQPRKHFDEDAQARLEEGIKSDGILQPLLVRESGNNPPYIIIEGERRWRAAKTLGMTEVPCLIRNDIDTSRIRFAQAMANANRENLTDYELAVVIQEYLDNNPKLKKKDVAAQLGKDAATVSRLLGLLDPEYETLAKAGLIENAATLSHFKALDEPLREQLLASAADGTPITREAVETAKVEAIQNQVQDSVSVSETVLHLGDSEPDNLESESGTTDDETALSVATPRQKESTGGGSSSIKLTLKVEDFELILPYFSDKEAEKVDLKFSHDTAIGLIENLGQQVPVDLSEFPQAIKEGIKALLGN